MMGKLRSIFIMFMPLTFMFGVSISDEESYYEDEYEKGIISGFIDIYLGIFCIRLLFHKR